MPASTCNFSSAAPALPVLPAGSAPPQDPLPGAVPPPREPKQMRWDVDRVETLTRLHLDERWSARRIAGELGSGFTRNAVIGKIHRLGLPTRGRMVPTSSKPPRVRRRLMFRPTPMPAPEPESKIDQDQIAELPAGQSPHAIALTATNKTHCRWPLDEPTHNMMVCGAPRVAGYSYCRHHARIAYPPRRAPGAA